MALHRREVGLVVVIRQVEFTGGAPQDATDVGVESVADPRKQMMLDLEVQTSGEPVQETVAGGEIRGCPHLVGRPIIRDGGGLSGGRGKIDLLHLVRQVENERESEAQRDMEDQ